MKHSSQKCCQWGLCSPVLSAPATTKTQVFHNIMHAAWWIPENWPAQKVFSGNVFGMLVIISSSWQALPTQQKLLFGTQLQRTPVLFAPFSRSNTTVSLIQLPKLYSDDNCSMIFLHLISGKIHPRISKCAFQIKKFNKGFLMNLQYLSCPKNGIFYWI